jgi:hypothetical protein
VRFARGPDPAAVQPREPFRLRALDHRTDVASASIIA